MQVAWARRDKAFSGVVVHNGLAGGAWAGKPVWRPNSTQPGDYRLVLGAVSPMY